MSPGKRKARAGTRADATSYRHQPEAYPEPLIPDHKLRPAEADLRRVTNRVAYEAEPKHWWLSTVERGAPCCPVCRREEWAEEWSA